MNNVVDRFQILYYKVMSMSKEIDNADNNQYKQKSLDFIDLSLDDIEYELNNRTQLAKAYELSSQYGVPYGELQDFPDPQSMERHAKALSRISKLEKTVQQATPAQQLSGATPGADVAPTDSGDVLDRYNAGDPAITTEMARSAAQKLGMTIFG